MLIAKSSANQMAVRRLRDVAATMRTVRDSSPMRSGSVVSQCTVVFARRGCTHRVLTSVQSNSALLFVCAGQRLAF